MADKKSFVIRHENTEQFDMLDDGQLGQIFRAMYRFSVNGTEPELDDPMLKMLWSVIRGQLERDAEKYAETCKKRSESGQKGGRPPKKAKKANGFSAFPEKTEKAKKADSDCVCDSVCECECDPEPEPDSVPVCECDPEPEPPDGLTQHTAHTDTAEISVSAVLEIVEKLGYSWDEEETQAFLAYNLDKGRTGGWGYAVRKWEQHRRRDRDRGSQSGKQGMSAQEREKMDGYLSLVNRFGKEQP